MSAMDLEARAKEIMKLLRGDSHRNVIASDDEWETLEALLREVERQARLEEAEWLLAELDRQGKASLVGPAYSKTVREVIYERFTELRHPAAGK